MAYYGGNLRGSIGVSNRALQCPHHQWRDRRRSGSAHSYRDQPNDLLIRSHYGAMAKAGYRGTGWKSPPGPGSPFASQSCRLFRVDVTNNLVVVVFGTVSVAL